MRNTKYNTQQVKTICENKLGIAFRATKEFNGWYILDGKKVCRITVPKGKKKIPKGTYQSMAKQLKLTTDQFDNLLDCPLDNQGYIKILKGQ